MRESESSSVNTEENWPNVKNVKGHNTPSIRRNISCKGLRKAASVQLIRFVNMQRCCLGKMND